MRNDNQKSGAGDGGTLVPRSGKGNNGIFPNSFKALSSYLRFVSSGASTVASTVRFAASAASAIVEKDGDINDDQVSWAGFDKLELAKGITEQVLLLGYTFGFQVWNVEVADSVHNIVSRHDGPVSFMQVLPKPMASKQSEDKFAGSRPLLIICADGSFSGGDSVQEGPGIPRNGSIDQCHGMLGSCVPTVIWFYSLKSQSYVHLLRFRSVIHLVRCSPRVVAVLQSTQIHCFNAATLEREYTIVTNPVVTGCYGSGNIGFGPLAVGPRWMAYSGSQVASSNGRVSPQHLTPSNTFPGPSPNGSLVAYYAKESSKHLAAGIVTLGDMGYKKLSKYYTELLPDGNHCQSGTACLRVNGVANGHLPDAENVGMVIVRDIVSKNVITQFRAHKSPILSLCFDPSGTILVTASVQGHNINVFRVMPSGGSSEGVSGSSYVHLYRLQRGFTNAIIQDISFSTDSQWIMISSSRGTSHLFAISPSGGSVNFLSTDGCLSPGNNRFSLSGKPGACGSPNSGLQVLTRQTVCASGPPLTLSAISRIRNGNNGWRSTVNGATAAATGRASSFSGAIASAFHNCKGNNVYADSGSMRKKYYMLVFSPSGCVIQYALRISPGHNGMASFSGASVPCESGLECDARIAVEAIQKWNICQKQNHKEREDALDMYGENGTLDSGKVHPEALKQDNNFSSNLLGTSMKEKITTEEKHHMYISEAELQMHQNRDPLWARLEIYFQPMRADVSTIDGQCSNGGEIEIERIPINMLETRAKNLVPVFDYLQAPKLQQGRNSVVDNHSNIQFQGLDLGSAVSEPSKQGCRSSSGSVDSMASGGTNMKELGNGAEETEHNVRLPTEMRGGSVNTCDASILNTRVVTVNTRETSLSASQLRSVHNRDALQTGNQFTEDVEFD